MCASVSLSVMVRVSVPLIVRTTYNKGGEESIETGTNIGFRGVRVRVQVRVGLGLGRRLGVKIRVRVKVRGLGSGLGLGLGLRSELG